MKSAFPVRGVGPQTIKHLSRLAIDSAHDLLFHFPSRYQDRSQLKRMCDLQLGDQIVVQGMIEQINFPPKGRTKCQCVLSDGTGKVLLRFFHLLTFQKKILTKGAVLRCYGEIKLGSQGWELSHPEFQRLYADNPPPEPYLTPIYPTTAGLSQYVLRKITQEAIALLENQHALKEWLPASITLTASLPTYAQAIKFLHQPPRETPLDHLFLAKTSAQQRLIFEELLAHRLSLIELKNAVKVRQSFLLRAQGELQKKFLDQFSFQLTNAQKRVLKEIHEDLAKSEPMLRLLQGDVGSGKTLIAALSMLAAVESGCQAVLMAPTELLAEQHYRTFEERCERIHVKVIFLAGSIKGRARIKALQSIASGEAQLIIGTHALFQQKVNFKKLALIVVDEQHRFGVEQRALLNEKGVDAEIFPHQLIMTATPIPRTLAMSFYADLDNSVLDELPPGRTPIVTTLAAAARRADIVERIKIACGQGKQAYWVCPFIEESEQVPGSAATNTAEALREALPSLRVGLIHGRMASKDKELVMQAFKSRHIDILVATTVIEVGVDVPNASIMVIENAERLGLAQLHQLRGRVGRGTVASFCVLLYQYPLSKLAKERLKVMRETNDGFQIAQRDLELRGPGEVLGTKQTGELTFKVADLSRDEQILSDVQQAADLIMRDHPEIIEPLVKRWLGKGVKFGAV